MNYKLTKYQGKWSVYDTKARVYYFIGCGKNYCQQRLNELNEGV
jgi:hypothetical protein